MIMLPDKFSFQTPSRSWKLEKNNQETREKRTRGCCVGCSSRFLALLFSIFENPNKAKQPKDLFHLSHLSRFRETQVPSLHAAQDYLRPPRCLVIYDGFFFFF